MKIALKVHDRDNVATIFAEVARGETVLVKDKKGGEETVTVDADIPYGHKIALCTIESGKEIFKYGEALGVASCEIKRGDYVHVHNLESTRGRGDHGEKQEVTV